MNKKIKEIKTIKVNGPTFLSNRGYAILKKDNEEFVEKLKKELTVSPRTNPIAMGNTTNVSFTVYKESIEKLYVPKYFGLQKFGLATISKIKDGLDISISFNGTIRPEQELPAKCFLDAVSDPLKMGGIISLPCGYGKTILALYLASVIKKKTLVVCHKEFLGNQWIERIEQFLPSATIGTIKQKVIDVENKDIVIASLQSIAMKDYSEDIFKDFGLVVFDEAHHLSAEVFSQCLPKTTTKRMMGLSATLTRKDGLTKVFEWYLGKPVYQIKRNDTDLLVIVKRFFDPDPDYSNEIKLQWNGKLNMAKMINNICDFAPRNKVIIDTLIELLEKEPDRQILILSERRNHLVDLAELLKNGGIQFGYYVGGMSQEELNKSAQKKVLLGTFQLAQEGMDVPTLNTLILASPVSSIEQAIGRIQRQQKSARMYQPLVIDIIDEFSMFEGQGKKRLAFYRKNKYTIQDAALEQPENTKYQFVKDSDEEC